MNNPSEAYLLSRFPFDNQTWIIADTHFFHANISVYCNRPDNWQALILENWNRLVGSCDVILHLGDLALARKADLEHLSAQLPGQIYLIRGNHDRHSKTFYQSLGFQIVPDPYEMLHPSGKRLIFSHRPILPLGLNTLNLHGHIHNNPAPGLGQRHINLSIEVRQYRPWQLSEVLKSCDCE